MAVYGRLEVVSTDHEVWVYKVDNPIQELSIEFSCVNPIQGSFVYPMLRT